MPTPREAVRACPPHQQHTPCMTRRGDPYMPGPLTRAVTGTREPPTSGLVLGAWVTGPDVQGLTPLQQGQEGRTLRGTVPLYPGPRSGNLPSSWPQAGAPKTLHSQRLRMVVVVVVGGI